MRGAPTRAGFFHKKSPVSRPPFRGSSETKIPAGGLISHTRRAMTGPVIRLVSVCQTPSFLSIVLPPAFRRKKEIRWVVENGDGVNTLYVVFRRKGGHDSSTLIAVFKDEAGKYGLSQKRKPLVSSARENPHHGGKSLNYGDTAGESFAHSSRRQEAFTKVPETELPVNINADVEGWRTKKGAPSNLPAQSMTGDSGSPIRAEGAASPVSSTLAEEGAGVNLHAGARQRGQVFSTKKAPCRVLHPGGQRG